MHLTMPLHILALHLSKLYGNVLQPSTAWLFLPLPPLSPLPPGPLFPCPTYFFYSCFFLTAVYQSYYESDSSYFKFNAFDLIKFCWNSGWSRQIWHTGNMISEKVNHISQRSEKTKKISSLRSIRMSSYMCCSNHVLYYSPLFSILQSFQFIFTHKTKAILW